MKPRTIYIIVEGPHDSSIVGKIVRKNGLRFTPISLRNQVDTYWDNLIPKSFPQENDFGEPEFGRVRVPDFLKSSDQSLAVQTAGGITKLAPLLKDDLELFGEKRPDAIGIVFDADARDAATAFAALKREIVELGINMQLPNMAGDILDGPPRVGVFVFPNNSRSGTLEDTMLECASKSYPQLLPVAIAAIDTVSKALSADPNWLSSPEHDDFNKPAGPNKARVSIIGSVMKPTYAIGNSYRQQRWITEDTLKLPLLGQLSSFLSNLIGER